MKLGGKIAVEQLDDERLTNLERRIVLGATAQPVRASRRWIGFAAATAAACAAAVIGWSLHRSDATIAPASERIAVHTVVEGSKLDIGDAVIESSVATAFTVERPNGGVLIEMSRGRVELDVAKRHERPALIVRAGETDVIVVGTHFSVDFHDGTGDCDVQVTEGIVRVVRRQSELRVAKGEEWHARDGLVIASADVHIDTSKTSIALHDHVAVLPPAIDNTKPHVTPTHPTERTDPPPTKRLDPPIDPQVELKAQIRQQPIAPALDVGLEPAASLKTYRTTANSTIRAQASHALYSMAVVQHLKLNRDDDALRTLDEYMARFEKADDYPAALWLRVRITCLRKVDDACHQAAYTYLSKAPNGDAAHLASILSTY